MLQSLKIENFVLIPYLNLEFDSGFTVFTGETGSGKSILLGALNLILGERADYTVIRDSDKKTIVEALFEIGQYNLAGFFEENDLDYSSEIIVRREIAGQGKSRAFINDTPVQLAVLKSLSERLIHIHSQHHTLELKNKDFQFDVLDYLTDSIEIRNKFRKQFAELKLNQAKLLEDELNFKNLVKEQDYINFQLTELKALNLGQEKYADLEAELELIEHSETIKQTFSNIIDSLNGDGEILDKLHVLKANLEKKTNLNPHFQAAFDRISSSYLDLKELSFESENASDLASKSDSNKEELERKLSLYNSQLIKHACKSQEELLAIFKDLELKNRSSEDFQFSIDALKSKLILLEKELVLTGELLQKNRLKNKLSIEKNIVSLLSDLKMQNCIVNFDLAPLDKPTINGFSALTIKFSPNEGIEEKSLEKAASGGELSRLMLAIQTLLSAKKQLPGIIFDEIDTGVSGEVAQKLGDLLQKMGSKMQIMAITHLPQVAARGNSHFKVQKILQNQKTTSTVEKLNEEERTYEIARLMSGENISEAAIENAKDLIKG